MGKKRKTSENEMGVIHVDNWDNGYYQPGTKGDAARMPLKPGKTVTWMPFNEAPEHIAEQFRDISGNNGNRVKTRP